MGKIPNDIYSQCYSIAKSYHDMLARRVSFAEDEACNAVSERNEVKIKALEQAWAQMADETEREFIKLNIFEGVRMHYIELPLSIRSMKRLRAKFIFMLAVELNEL